VEVSKFEHSHDKSASLEQKHWPGRNKGSRHWHKNNIKLALMDKVHSPALDSSITTAILQCTCCKGFGSTHLHALLNPIIRWQSFELLVGDYFTLPEGKGGYQQLGLYLDTCTQHVWGYKFKTHGSRKTTAKSLKDIFYNFTTPETFMTDGHIGKLQCIE